MKEFGSAVILAGGKSSRMGFDKSMMIIDQGKLIDNTISKLEEIFDDIIISVNSIDKKLIFNYDNLVVDKVVDAGPLGGILSALEQSKSQNLFIIPCDMPNIDMDYIKYLMAQMDNNEAILSGHNDKLEPFPGFYSKAIIPNIETMLSENKRSMTSLISLVKSKIVTEDDWKGLNFKEEMFINLNTIEDIKKYMNFK